MNNNRYSGAFSPLSSMSSMAPASMDYQFSLWSPPVPPGHHQQPPPYRFFGPGPNASYPGFHGPMPAHSGPQQYQFGGPAGGFGPVGPVSGYQPTCNSGPAQCSLHPHGCGTPHAPIMTHRKPSCDNGHGAGFGPSMYGGQSSFMPLGPPPSSGYGFPSGPNNRPQGGPYYPVYPPHLASQFYPGPEGPAPPGLGYPQHQPPPPYRPFDFSSRQGWGGEPKEWSQAHGFAPQRAAWGPPAPPGPAHPWVDPSPWADDSSRQKPVGPLGYGAPPNMNKGIVPSHVPVPHLPYGQVGGGFGAVGEKRHQFPKPSDEEYQESFVPGPIAPIIGQGNVVDDPETGELDLDKLMSSVVYPDYDQNPYAHPPDRSATPPPPPPPEPQVEYQLVPAINPVLPPPPIEKSAVPLSGLGAGMVWEICAAALGGPVSTLRRAAFKLSPSEPFGVIGGEVVSRSRRRSAASDCFSSMSTPFGSAVTSPNNDWIKHDMGAIDDRFALPGSATQVDASSSSSNGHGSSWSPWEPNPDHSTDSPGSVYLLGPYPTKEFNSFVESVLTQTLLTPHVLLLAVFYVAKVTVSQKALAPSSPLSIDPASAPSKLILAALMVANKMLDDNSYRSETFASVSDTPLNELNSVETWFLGALDFDLNLDRPGWKQWVANRVIPWNKRHMDHVDSVEAMLDSIAEHATASFDEDDKRLRYANDQDEPQTFNLSMPSNTYMLSPKDYDLVDFDDESGPVKSPFQFNPKRYSTTGANCPAVPTAQQEKEALHQAYLLQQKTLDASKTNHDGCTGCGHSVSRVV